MPPFYDWKCNNCENCFETMTSFSEYEKWQTEGNNILCPKCASPAIVKLVSQGTSFQYKGKGNGHMSGWYGKDKKR